MLVLPPPPTESLHLCFGPAEEEAKGGGAEVWECKWTERVCLHNQTGFAAVSQPPPLPLPAPSRLCARVKLTLLESEGL